MLTGIEARVAFLEGRVVEHSHRQEGVRQAVAGLEHRMEQRFADVDRRVDALDAKVSRQFMWLVGLQMTTLVAIVAALVAQ